MTQFNPDYMSPPKATIVETLCTMLCLDSDQTYQIMKLVVDDEFIGLEEATFLCGLTGVPAQFWLERQKLYEVWKKNSEK